MRQEKPTLCGRDHISYRSYYLPAKVSEQLSRTLRWFEGTRLLKRVGSMFFVSTIYAILSSLQVSKRARQALAAMFRVASGAPIKCSTLPFYLNASTRLSFTGRDRR